MLLLYLKECGKGKTKYTKQNVAKTVLQSRDPNHLPTDQTKQRGTFPCPLWKKKSKIIIVFIAILSISALVAPLLSFPTMKRKNRS